MLCPLAIIVRITKNGQDFTGDDPNDERRALIAAVARMIEEEEKTK